VKELRQGKGTIRVRYGSLARGGVRAVKGKEENAVRRGHVGDWERGRWIWGIAIACSVGKLVRRVGSFCLFVVVVVMGTAAFLI
jgi:hypothetical protein